LIAFATFPKVAMPALLHVSTSAGPLVTLLAVTSTTLATPCHGGVCSTAGPDGPPPSTLDPHSVHGFSALQLRSVKRKLFLREGEEEEEDEETEDEVDNKAGDVRSSQQCVHRCAQRVQRGETWEALCATRKCNGCEECDAAPPPPLPTPATVLKDASSLLGALKSTSKDALKSSWSIDKIRAYMKAHPQRAYFSQLFQQGGFRVGMEVGVADGRFSEHFLLSMKDTVSDWWEQRGIGKTMDKHFYKNFSTDTAFLAQVSDKSSDFIYLDGAHDYKNVKQELVLMFRKVRPGGVLAGHDYCNHGEPGLECKGCNDIPKCQPYSAYGVKRGKPRYGRAANQNGVVKAVQEYLVETHPELELLHTVEDFTRESLAQDGLDYDLVITMSRNPSWYFFIPE